jgi:hypothetical protein
MNWPPERIEELLTLWGRGLTSYQLADHFGASRNAICGKLHRERVKRGHVVERRRDSYKRNPFKRKAMDIPAIPDRASTPAPVPPFVADESRFASIVDVTGCRFHVRDDADFVGGVAFCNHPQKEGSSYCAYHARKAVMPYKPKPIEGTLAPLGLRFPKRAA